jgi:hypothetical protein
VVECSREACSVDASGVPNANASASPGCAPFSCPSGKGTCAYMGKTFAVGEGFGREDNCNKCMCVADGTIECTAESCTTPGCGLGRTLLRYGQTVTCSDGCNACTCTPNGFIATERACPPLANIPACDAAASSLAFPAPLAYQAGDVIAVTESRCVNGQTNDFSLCYGDLVATGAAEVALFVAPGSTTRSCSGTERVYSLSNLRDAIVAASGQKQGKIILRGGGDGFVYEFRL